jgi:ubiquinone/menaquinone biosynthesis C-methylase UbiE
MEAFDRKVMETWDGQPAVTLVPERRDSCSGLVGPHRADEFAEKLFAWEALTPCREPATKEPYTLQWFLEIENQRHGRQGRWIPKLMEFSKHAGETLLGLGSGLGTDWIQYARHGASVIVCSTTTEQLQLARRNFELRGLAGRFVHASPACLPLCDSSIDVACVSGLFHEIANPQPIIDEMYRVLKPGGKILAVAAARYDVDFWANMLFPWLRWLGLRRYPRPNGPAYSARGLKRLFHRFVEHRIHKRHLRRSETPHVWRWLPMPLLERLFGRILVLKAFKPLSAAMTAHPRQAAG